jgi:rod shape-determining protein MreD
MRLRRVLGLAGVIVAGLLLESTVFAVWRLGGVRPDLLMIAVVAVAMGAGPVEGAAFGFSAGLLADLLFGQTQPVGVSALAYTATGFAVGALRAYVTSSAAWVHLALTAAASLASVWLTGLVLRVFDQSSWGYVARAGLLVAAANLLLAPLVYPLVRRLVERTAPAEAEVLP